MKRWLPVIALACVLPVSSFLESVEIVVEQDAKDPADLIIHRAKVVTVDDKFRVVEALAVRGERIIALGDEKAVLRHKGPKTRVIDAQGKTVLPGLYDSHVHPVG